MEENLRVILALKAKSYAASTMAQDNGSNWNWWAAWCNEQGTSPIRVYYESRATLQEACREHFLWSAAIPWILVRMRPGPGRVVPKPQSATAVLRGIRRIHVSDLEFDPPPSRMLNRVLRGIMNRYAELHGPEALQPHRTVPIPHHVTVELHLLYKSCGRTVLPGLVTDGATSLHWQSVAALSATHKETGLRKAETTSKTRKFTKLDLSLKHCRWNIAGHYVSPDGPTESELNAMVAGRDFLALDPPPSKSDQWGIVWGHRPIYLSYRPDREINAATEIRALELKFAVHGAEKRRNVPLFRDNRGGPLTGSAMDKLMVAALKCIGCGFQYSWHGYRAALACSLLQAKKSHAEIKSLCRWQTDDSLLVYAQLTHTHYSELLDDAYGADISTIQPKDVPVISEQAVAQDLFDYDVPKSFDD